MPSDQRDLRAGRQEALKAYEEEAVDGWVREPRLAAYVLVHEPIREHAAVQMVEEV